MIKRLGKAILSLGVMVALYAMGTFLIYTDLSLEPIPQEYRDMGNRPPVYLVTYAGGPEVFHQNQNFIVYSGINKGIDHFLNYRRALIDPAFIHKHQAIFDVPAGGGLWLWKPWIILDAMQHAPEDAIIIYMDTGFSICGSLDHVFKRLQHNDIILVQHAPDKSKYVADCTKFEILKREGTDMHWAKSNLPTMGGFIVVRNNHHSKAFIKEWLELCQKPNYLSGEGYAGNAHHQDQSLLSIVYSKHQDQVSLMPELEMDQMVTWHHRHPSRQDVTLLPYLRKHQTAFERRLMNLPGLKELRFWLRRHTSNIFERHPQADHGL